ISSSSLINARYMASGSVAFLYADLTDPLCVRTQIAVSSFDTSRPTNSGSILLSCFQRGHSSSGRALMINYSESRQHARNWLRDVCVFVPLRQSEESNGQPIGSKSHDQRLYRAQPEFPEVRDRRPGSEHRRKPRAE